MQIICTDSLTNEQKGIVCQLWNQEYPAQLNYQSLGDFEDYLEKLTGAKHYLFLDEARQIRGWACSFLRDHEKWFAVIVDAASKGQGVGTRLLDQLKSNEDTLNGWVVDHDAYFKKNGAHYRSPLPFYEKNRFAIHTDSRLEVEKLSALKITWQKTAMPAT